MAIGTGVLVDGQYHVTAGRVRNGRIVERALIRADFDVAVSPGYEDEKAPVRDIVRMESQAEQPLIGAST